MIYLDTSVVVALLTLEPMTDRVTRWFSGISTTLVSSDWLRTEFSSALSMKVRTGQIGVAVAEQVRAEFDELTTGGVRLVPVGRGVFVRAAELVRQHTHGLRAGDSLHLAVALELGVSHMATLDVGLAANARRCGMELVEF